MKMYAKLSRTCFIFAISVTLLLLLFLAMPTLAQEPDQREADGAANIDDLIYSAHYSKLLYYEYYNLQKINGRNPTGEERRILRELSLDATNNFEIAVNSVASQYESYVLASQWYALTAFPYSEAGSEILQQTINNYLNLKPNVDRMEPLQLLMYESIAATVEGLLHIGSESIVWKEEDKAFVAEILKEEFAKLISLGMSRSAYLRIIKDFPQFIAYLMPQLSSDHKSSRLTMQWYLTRAICDIQYTDAVAARKNEGKNLSLDMMTEVKWDSRSELFRTPNGSEKWQSWRSKLLMKEKLTSENIFSPWPKVHFSKNYATSAISSLANKQDRVKLPEDTKAFSQIDNEFLAVYFDALEYQIAKDWCSVNVPSSFYALPGYYIVTAGSSTNKAGFVTFSVGRVLKVDGYNFPAE